jgi:hypothetical protein
MSSAAEWRAGLAFQIPKTLLTCAIATTSGNFHD